MLTESLPSNDDNICLEHYLWGVLAERLDALECSELCVFFLDEAVALVDRPQGDHGVSGVDKFSFSPLVQNVSILSATLTS